MAQHDQSLSPRPDNVTRDGNQIRIHAMNHRNVVGSFYHEVASARRAGYDDLVVDFTRVTAAYPDACAPIAAGIRYLRTIGMDIETVVEPKSYMEVTRLVNPLERNGASAAEVSDPISKVWAFSDERDIDHLVNALVTCVSERMVCSEGVLLAVEWCVNEVMDNVLQHSRASGGYFMAQVHPNTGRLAICIADTGVGVLETLRNTHHRPRSHVDALTLAVKEGVTRDASIGQGNGLCGLCSIVSKNGGVLALTSGRGYLSHIGTDVKSAEGLPFLDSGAMGMIVDFQLNVSCAIDIASALGGHDPVNLRLEALESGTGEHVIIVREIAHGTGTRRSAEQLRNLVMNLFVEGATTVVLDFAGIGVISSSFADELVAKMLMSLGFFGFQERVRLANLSNPIRSIVERSIAQRMAAALSKTEPAG